VTGSIAPHQDDVVGGPGGAAPDGEADDQG
jgi:hypothetical protein